MYFNLNPVEVGAVDIYDALNVFQSQPRRGGSPVGATTGWSVIRHSLARNP